MIDKDIISHINNFDEKEKVQFLLNYSLMCDNEWKELFDFNQSLCINIATSFSGIGSPEYSLKRLGICHNILFAGDIDIFCKETYFANYDISLEQWHNDVRLFNASQHFNNVDLFVGGSPCQSFSIGGKRKGLEESRGTLFYEYARLVNECKPKVFIYENVTGIMNHDNGHTWDVVSKTFDELGYVWIPWVLNAKDYGIPQNRKRVYVVGFRSDIVHYANKLKKPQERKLVYEVEDVLEHYVPNKYYLPEKGFLRVIDRKHLRHVALNSKISRTQIANQQYNWYGDIRIENTIPTRIEEDARIFKGEFNENRCVARCLTPRECLRLMGYDEDFKITVNDQQQYKQCGNSIVVNVMMEVIKAIIKTGVYYAQ